jgi:phosphoribosyl 1,2-cyclic phosphate phosphodiesterase
MSIEEAIELGKQVQAKEIVLTHLAMHYSIPVTVAELQKQIKRFGNVLLAFDGMTFKM